MKATFYLNHGDLLMTVPIWTKEVNSWEELAKFCKWFKDNNIVDEADIHTLTVEARNGKIERKIDLFALDTFIDALYLLKEYVEKEYEGG